MAVYNPFLFTPKPTQAPPAPTVTPQPPAPAPAPNQADDQPPPYTGPSADFGGWAGGIFRQDPNGTLNPNPQGPNPNYPPSAGQPAAPRYAYMEGVDVNKLNDPSHQSEKYIASRILASGGTLEQAAAAIGATVLDATRMRLRTGEIIDTRRDEEGANVLQWLVQGGGAAGDTSGTSGAPAAPTAGTVAGTSTPGTGTAAGGTSNVAANPNVFTDPATTEWETLLRQLVDRMNVPQPTWTPAQLELQQTQALDPLERQRQAQRQQMGQRLASRGITPGSGIFESAMADIDRQFNQLRTQTQGAFATRAIEREDQVFRGNEERATNAVNTMRQIPQLADQRLATAQGTIQQANPYGLLQLQQQIERDRWQQQQYQQQQDQQFWAQIAYILQQAF